MSAEIKGDVVLDDGDKENLAESQKLVKIYERLLAQKEIVISDLNPEVYGDKSLILQIALRGKTVDEFYYIVNGLFTASELEEDQIRRDALGALSSEIMSIGERNLGIDWS
jgi:hypothetical protein